MTTEQVLRPNCGPLLAALETLAKIGVSAQGGIDRPAYSAAYRQAVDWLKAQMVSAGLRVREDAAGNVIGRLGPDGPALVCGSHIDTVPQGGRYDGALGVLAALECARALKPQESRLACGFEVVAFVDEEGAYVSLLGSRAMTGSLSSAEIARAVGRDGRKLADSLAAYGLDPLKITSAARRSEDFAAYLELHIEQGPVLEQEALDIGIVGSIVGIRTHVLTLTGTARHAGTTPLAARRDPLRAAGEAIAWAYDAMSDRKFAEARLTFGQIAVEPGAANVVPGVVRLTREIRGADAQIIDTVESLVDRLFRDSARRHGVTMEATLVDDDKPVTLGKTIAQTIADTCRADGRTFRHLMSGAGHDAQSFAPICDTGMIFVPSRDGISHHPDEYSSPDQIRIGLEILYRTCCRLLFKA